MPEIVRRYDSIVYDGSNSTDVLQFFSDAGLGDGSWSILSEENGHLVLEFTPEDPGGPFPPPDPIQVELDTGDLYTKFTHQGGESQWQGPWSSTLFQVGNAQVPTASEFAALEARVAALEASQT